MRRGTTPYISITTDTDLSQARNLYVTFTQHGVVVFEKELEDCTVTENSVTVHLTQKETLSLSEKFPIECQIRATLGVEKLASNVMKTNVETILKSGEI